MMKKCFLWSFTSCGLDEQLIDRYTNTVPTNYLNMNLHTPEEQKCLIFMDVEFNWMTMLLV